MRRQRIVGMTRADDHILEFLWNGGADELIANPKVIAVNIDYQPDTVRKRMAPLREAGLVEYYDESGGLYQITDLGRRRLDGELEDEEVDEIEEILNQ